MIDDQTLDLIYEVSGVGSLAIINHQGELYDNQLPILEDQLSAIITSVMTVHNDFLAAGRDVRGFTLKSESMTLMVAFFDNIVLIIEVLEPCSLNAMNGSLNSIFSRNVSGVKSAPITTATLQTSPVTTAAATGTATSATQSTAESPAGENNIDFATFKTSLTKILKKVAPANLAEKMITDTLTVRGVDPSATLIDRKEAVKLGFEVISKIPNKKRKKLIENEFTLLSKTF